MPNDADIDNEDAAEYENEDAGFEQAPKELFIPGYERDPDAPVMSHAAVRLYMVMRHFGATANFRVRNDKLAEAMGGCTVRYVQKIRDELLDAGWLLVTPTYRTAGDHGQASNRYKVMWRRIRGPEDPRARAHAEQLAKIEKDRLEATRQRRAGGTLPMFP
jgi:hypothetical protein